MNVKSNFFVAICVWQIIWSANGLKLSISNVSSKSAPVKASSASNPLLKNSISSSPSEKSLASFLSKITSKSSNNLSQEGIENGYVFPSVEKYFPPSSPLSSSNSVTSENIFSNSLKETESSNLGSSVFDPLSYQSLLSSSNSNLEATNNNLLSAIQSSLNVQNNNFIPLQSTALQQLFNNGLLQSLQNSGTLQRNLNSNLFTSIPNIGANNNILSKSKNLLESNLLTNSLLNSQNLAAISNIQGITSNFEQANNNILSSLQNSVNAQNNNFMPTQSRSSSRLINEQFLNNDLVSPTPISGLLPPVTSTLQNELLESNSLSHLLSGVGSVANNQLTQTLGSTQSNIFSNNLIQTNDINPFLETLGSRQSNGGFNNIQNLQNLQSQIDPSFAQLSDPSFNISPNLINDNIFSFPPLDQKNSNSIHANVINNNNNLLNALSNTASISNSNNAFLNNVAAYNLLSSTNSATELTKPIIQNNINTNPLLSEGILNKIALSEVLSDSPLSITNTYNKINLPVPVDILSQTKSVTNSDLVSNYNKNVLLQELNNDVFDNVILNNNNNLKINNLSAKFPPKNTIKNEILSNIVSQNNLLNTNNQNLLSNLASTFKPNNGPSIGSYLYNNLMNKLQSPKPIDNKLNTEIDISDQVNLNPSNNNIITETSISNNVQNTDYLNKISNTQASSAQTSSDISSKLNNLPRIPSSPSASLNSLINNINTPNTDYFESLTRAATTADQLYNGGSVTDNLKPTVPNNCPKYFNLPCGNNFVPNYNKLINNDRPSQSKLGPILIEAPKLYPEIPLVNNQSPQSLGLGTSFNTVSSSQSTDIPESLEIKAANTVSSLYPLLPNINPSLSKFGPIYSNALSSQAIFPTNNIEQPSLLQTLYPVTGLPSVNTNLGATDNNFILNRINENFQSNALSNLIITSTTPNLNFNDIPEGFTLKPNPYLPNDVVPSPDLIKRLKLLESNSLKPEPLSSVSPEYREYLNLISRLSSQPSIPTQQNLDLSALTLANQLSSMNNLAEVTGSKLNSNQLLSSSPVSANNKLYSSLYKDSTLTTNSLTNTDEISLDSQISVNTSTNSTESSLESVTVTSSSNPYAVPSIADLPTVLASNYFSLPQLYNNVYSQISPSNLIVPKIENLISIAGLTKSITDLGNEIAKSYIDNLRVKKPVYPQLVYNSVTPTASLISSTETINSNTNVSPVNPTQPSYPTIDKNTFIESKIEAEQPTTYPFPFSSLPQTKVQTEFSQGPMLPTFYPTEFSIYSPSMLPTPNINYPVYPPYIPPPMNFPPIPPLFPPIPSIIETPILKIGSNNQNARKLIEILLLTGLLNNNDCNDRGTLEALIALMFAT